MYSDELLLPWFHRLAGRVPGLRLFDAHTHLGDHDPDGSRLALPDLLDALRLADAQAVTFPLMEPGGYREANTAVIAAAAGSEGRLVAFCRGGASANRSKTCVSRERHLPRLRAPQG